MQNSTSSFSVLIIDSQPENRATVTAIVRSTMNASLLTETDSAMYGYELIRQNRPRMIFLDLSLDPVKTLAMASQIATFFKDTLIIGSGPEVLDIPSVLHTDISEKDRVVATLKACMEAGIREYLPRPLDAAAVQGVFDKYRPALIADDGAGDRTGRIISVFSNKGGIGKTTIAVNLALALSELVGKPVALVDLNFQLGDITTFLDVEPKQTIVDIARNISRVDAAYLESSLAQYSSDHARLYVLADPVNVEDAEELTTDQINAVLTVLRASFEYVIVDTTAAFDAKTLCALDLTDQILMVSIVNLPSIRSSQRLLNLFSRLGYPTEKIKLVLNRYISREEITAEDVAETLDHPIFWKIPNSYQVVMTAINRGIPIKLVENGQELHQQFMGLAHLLSGRIVGKTLSGKVSALVDDAPSSLTKSVFKSLMQRISKS
jgi:pilus assembly protein CpaE